MAQVSPHLECEEQPSDLTAPPTTTAIDSFIPSTVFETVFLACTRATEMVAKALTMELCGLGSNLSSPSLGEALFSLGLPQWTRRTLTPGLFQR